MVVLLPSSSWNRCKKESAGRKPGRLLPRLPNCLPPPRSSSMPGVTATPVRIPGARFGSVPPATSLFGSSVVPLLPFEPEVRTRIEQLVKRIVDDFPIPVFMFGETPDQFERALLVVQALMGEPALVQQALDVANRAKVGVVLRLAEDCRSLGRRGRPGFSIAGVLGRWAGIAGRPRCHQSLHTLRHPVPSIASQTTSRLRWVSVPDVFLGYEIHTSA
jgi:hypothetical protein